MANGHGGYREPRNPAPVSGPGALSARTDGSGQPVRDLPNAKYGENTAFRAAEEAAPMTGPDLSQLVSFGAPSQRPAEPITAGLPTGEGPGGTMPPPSPPVDPQTADRLRSYLPVFIVLASMPEADSATKQYVRQLRAELG